MNWDILCSSLLTAHYSEKYLKWHNIILSNKLIESRDKTLLVSLVKFSVRKREHLNKGITKITLNISGFKND